MTRPNQARSPLGAATPGKQRDRRRHPRAATTLVSELRRSQNPDKRRRRGKSDPQQVELQPTPQNRPNWRLAIGPRTAESQEL